MFFGEVQLTGVTCGHRTYNVRITHAPLRGVCQGGKLPRFVCVYIYLSALLFYVPYVRTACCKLVFLFFLCFVRFISECVL